MSDRGLSWMVRLVLELAVSSRVALCFSLFVRLPKIVMAYGICVPSLSAGIRVLP